MKPARYFSWPQISIFFADYSDVENRCPTNRFVGGVRCVFLTLET